ncbi:hypothetical protein PAXRUDRAFT_36987 [Paxillus rubicundulus Ve08.2h10]|uniref:Uncharacterized protein n=1 Tax=Paxillus rubicundulus Ve08.2h10 TaxID=930991 RepID=A0A0D0CWA4_9AGAM|nr:hypothetical protein PAXRUDRAFT_36987 [Paxillus rubicundulus Ve08.2h10]
MEDHKYDKKVRQLEYAVVHSKQIHTCAHRRCLVPNKYGHYYCKRNAPFDLSPEDTVDTDGQWHSKRLYGYLNGWMPALSINIHCNNDAKLLTNGGDTRNVSFYMTSYQTKKQGKNFNVSAVMAKGYANHIERMNNADYLQGLRDEQCLLLFRIVHAINHEQELSVPMVISYLMGWGDTFRSHHYTPVYWLTFTQVLLATFPSLGAHYSVARHSEHMSEHTQEHGDSESKSQVIDYGERGDVMENMNVVDFFSNSYETTKPNAAASESTEISADRQISLRGHPQHQRVPYCLLNFIGSYFPHNDDDDKKDLYGACMLMLFKPWRNFRTDLKDVSYTWTEAFQEFKDSMSMKQQNMLDNIQYFYECECSAQVHRQQNTRDASNDDRNTDEGDEDKERCRELSEEVPYEVVPLLPVVSSEEIHGMLAVKAGKQAKIFPNECNVPPPKTSSVENLGALEDSVTVVEADMLNIDQQRAYDIITWHLDHTLEGHDPPTLHMILYGNQELEN